MTKSEESGLGGYGGRNIKTGSHGIPMHGSASVSACLRLRSRPSIKQCSERKAVTLSYLCKTPVKRSGRPGAESVYKRKKGR